MTLEEDERDRFSGSTILFSLRKAPSDLNWIVEIIGVKSAGTFSEGIFQHPVL